MPPVGALSMDFIPETRTVVNDLVRLGAPDIGELLLEMAAGVQAIVPDLVGMSVGQTRLGLVFTLVASSVEAAGIDAVQYLDGGPCVDASTHGTTEAWSVQGTPPDGVLDEQRWVTFARATATEGVASSLSLPLFLDGRIVGGVNLYAATPDAFEGHHDALARALGAEVSSVVANADLSFATRDAARHAPHQLADQDLVDQATGVLAARHDLSMDLARERLSSTARRAGITDVQAAETLIRALGQ